MERVFLSAGKGRPAIGVKKPSALFRKGLAFTPDVAQGLALLGQRAFLLLEIPVFLGLPTLLRVPTLGAGDAALRAGFLRLLLLYRLM